MMWCYMVVCDDDGADVAVFDDMTVGAGMTVELTWWISISHIWDVNKKIIFLMLDQQSIIS